MKYVLMFLLFLSFSCKSEVKTKVKDLTLLPPLEIYDFSGKRVMQHTIKNSISTFSTKDFKSGIYLYEIKDHGIVLESGKIIFD